MWTRRETVIALVVTFGILALSLLQLNQVDFIYGFGQLLLYFIFFCTGIYALYRFTRDKRQVSLFRKATPFLFCFLLATFLFLLWFIIDTDGGKEVIIVADVDHGVSFIHVQLFDNKTFKLLNSGPFGGNFYRGTYSLVNDTLNLNNESLRYLYPTLTLILNDTDHNRKYFESLDTLKFKDKLFVTVDNR